MARSAMPPCLRAREGGGTTYSGATLRTLWTPAGPTAGARRGRDLLEDVAHRGVAVAVELVFAALGDDVDLVHDGGDGADQAAPRRDGRQRGNDLGGGDGAHVAPPSPCCLSVVAPHPAGRIGIILRLPA